MIDIDRLRYVVLHDVSQQWDDPIVAGIFRQIVDLKLRGYRDDYPPGALAVDTTDFVGTHIILATETEPEELSVLAALKWTTLARCVRYNIDFPALSVVRSLSSDRHEKAVRLIVDDHAEVPDALAYCAGWTAHPAVRQDRDLARRQVQMMIGAHLLSCEDMGVAACISAGVPRMNTDKVELSAGYERMADELGPLPPFPLRNLVGEPVILMHLRDHSEWAQGFADRYRNVWDARLTFGSLSA